MVILSVRLVSQSFFPKHLTIGFKEKLVSLDLDPDSATNVSWWNDVSFSVKGNR